MDLVEREQTLALLEALFEEVEAGEGRSALISGPVGTGKTALLGRAVTAVAGPALVLSARCSRAEQSLAMGVIDQLLHSPAWPAEVRAPLLQQFGQAGLPCAAADLPHSSVTSTAVTVSNAMLSLALRRPLVVVVDDIQWADRTSLAVLAIFLRRISSSRILVLLTESTSRFGVDWEFRAELHAQPGFLWLRLRRLSAAGTGELVRRRAGAEVAARSATAYHDASGGNPLLLNALLRDHLSGGTGAAGATSAAEADEPIVAGESFARAVQACLHRCEPAVREIAQALAVLPDDNVVGRSRRLLDLNTHDVVSGVSTLAEIGLVENGAFRHPAARRGVLDSLSLEEWARHHARAARLMYLESAPAPLVASLLLLAGETEEPWAPGVLLEAALEEDEPARALEMIDLAARSTSDERERALVVSARVRIEWRANPAAAQRGLPALQDAMRQGHLTDWSASALILYLLWHGKADEVSTTWNLLKELPPSAEPPEDSELRAMHLWTQYLHPESRSQLDTLAPPVPEDAGPAQEMSVLAASALTAVLTEGPDEERVVDAEYVLSTCRLGDTTVEWLLVALLTLIYAGRLDRASTWCDSLLAEANVRGVVTWQAILSAASADIALRTGETETALELATAALDLVPLEGWGVVVGYPLGCLLTAALVTGRLDDIGDEVWDAVPDKMFASGFGVQYLHARAYHLLITSRPRAAVDEFRRCGEVMRDWGLDNPLLAAWRHGAAEAYLVLGEVDEARELLAEEAGLPGAGDAVVRGGWLRLRAATEEQAPARVSLLRQSVELLEAGANRIELMLALASLANAHSELGEFGRAKLVARRARQMAKLSGAAALCDEILSVALTRRRQTSPQDTVEQVARAALSDAEFRVANLVSRGMTNREISAELFLTVSTIEQHLTRIYRKLDVKGRPEMVSLLQWGIGASRSRDTGVS
ncbi:AAA family ATPase [Amycolatopsis sp. NPDC005232]|uniref:helix-turn-helix transcriptional regulator n=1 Tax=Amycolatopsis sp. NPDC005232 TaxID=3157027 RepID=UPI0033B5C7EA